MSDDDKKDKEEFDFWNPKNYEHDDVMFPWRKGHSIPGVNAPPVKEDVPTKKDKRKGCLSWILGRK
jgi:hypothetical protein